MERSVKTAHDMREIARSNFRGGENLSVPADAEESLSDYYRERDHQQEKRDREEAFWAQQERLQEETDDT